MINWGDEDALKPISVFLSPEGIEIDFYDPRRSSNGVTEITKISVERSALTDLIEQIEADVSDLIEEALTIRRR